MGAARAALAPLLLGASRRLGCVAMMHDLQISRDERALYFHRAYSLDESRRRRGRDADIP